MASSITFKSNTYGPRTLYLRLSQTKNIADNTSTIKWTFSSEGSNSSASLFLVYATTIKINGTQVYYKGDTQWYGNGSPENPKAVFPAAEGSTGGSITVKHNNDGTLTIPIYFYTGVYASKYKANYGGNWTLDSIPREATISAADNFTDEGNPTVTYSNPAGDAVSNLDISIYDPNGQTAYAGYRAATKTGTSYTFNLTDAERTALRKAATGNTLDVRFYLRTKIGDYTGYSSIAKTMTITNGNPTLNPTVVDSNNTTKALTGDANKLVKYYSNAAYTIGAAAIKESTLSSQSVTHNGVKKTSATGTYNAVENASFTFEAKDSRGNTTTKTITKTLINYVKLTCNQKIEISVNGVATINVSGNYFNGSFGTTANTLTVEYRYKTSGGTYSNWTATTVTKSGNTYSATATKSGLNYQTNYVFQCRAIDKLATVNTEEKTLKALPVFDWGEDDFAFNVPVVFNAGFTQGASVIGEEVAASPDYVEDQGLANGWYYRKWNSGTIELWAVQGVNTAISTAYGNGYYNGATLGITLPEEVVTTVSPVININAQASNAQICDATIAAYNAETRKISYYITSSSSRAASDVYVHFRVIGRWK